MDDRLFGAEQNGEVDPDPFSVFLVVLGAVGSVASIVSYVEFKREQWQQQNEVRHKLLREVRDLLMSLEVDTMQLEASLHKLELLLIVGSDSHRQQPLANIPLRFGSCRPLFTLFGFRHYDEVMTELNNLAGRSFETTSKLLQRLYNIDSPFNGEVSERLIDLQNRLNRTLRDDTTYERGFRIYYEILAFTKATVREMRIQVDGHL